MGAKILLVTADTENMSKLEMALRPHGHEVVPVQNLTEASVMLEGDSTWDMIVCDLIFPLEDSFTLLEAVRANHLISDLPFIFLVEEQQLLTEALRKAAAIHDADKFIFMDQFEPHRMRCEIDALLPEQISSHPLPPDAQAQRGHLENWR